MLNILYIFSYHLRSNNFPLRCPKCIEIRGVVINNVILFNSRTVLNVSQLKREFRRSNKYEYVANKEFRINARNVFLESINI